MATTSIQQSINGMKLGSADKKVLSNLLAGLIGDLETLRSANYAMAQKLDAAGASVAGLGTNFVATVAIAPGKLVVGK